MKNLEVAAFANQVPRLVLNDTDFQSECVAQNQIIHHIITNLNEKGAFPALHK